MLYAKLKIGCPRLGLKWGDWKCRTGI